MSHPSPYAGSGNHLTNFNREDPPAPQRNLVSQDTAWSSAFFATVPTWPFLRGYPGFIPFDPTHRAYYLSAEGWRDTETGVLT